MTSHSSLLDSVMPLSIKSIQVANGTPMSILGVGNVSLSPRLLMSFVLLVPSLSNGLLSVSKITKHLNCFVTFNSTHHVFHDNLMKMTIDIDKEREGFYSLERARKLQFEFDLVFQVARKRSDRENIILWHCQLGHRLFYYLKYLFPQLFRKFSIFSLRCEQCIYAKNHSVPFKISLNKSLILFIHVFTNIWGPFSTLVLGHKYCLVLMIVLE